MPTQNVKLLLPHFRPIRASPNLIDHKMGQFGIMYPFVRLFDVFTAILAFAFSFGLAVIVALILVYIVQSLLRAIRGQSVSADERHRREN